MVRNFPTCLAFTYREEGGFSNDARDPGGATNLGITRATLSRWLKRPASVADVQALTKDTATPIYHDWYWATVAGESLPNGIDLMVFDEGVNTGEHESCLLLQEAIGLTDGDLDGHIGDHTLSVLLSRDPVAVITAIAVLQEAYYRTLKNFLVFGDEWLGRLARRVAAAKTLVAAPG